MRCPKCGSDENGRFCSKCGAEVRKKSGGVGGARCSKCGKGLEPKAMFCAECGEPTGHRPAKGATAYLPWVLSGLALVAFAIALTMFIQGQTAVRVGDMPPTGALPVAERVNPDGTPVTSAPAAGPGGVDLGSMSPRQAADRLFDRVMREDEAGNEAQAQQFATMAIQAYGMLPPAEIDLDARFHLGLLNLVLDDPDAADQEADLMLAVDSQHLLAFALKARSAGLRGDTAAQQAAYTMFLDALPAGLTAGNPEYAMHDNMLESEAVRAREATGRN
ncbi:MAG: zinc ribbon domain-containing protein [marine benthic group bacterium]|nr:zinc ribbon domain-containing protein [Gemmatimonadota bacterium]